MVSGEYFFEMSVFGFAWLWLVNGLPWHRAWPELGIGHGLFLGYVRGDIALIVELSMPMGASLRNHTTRHERGHLAINALTDGAQWRHNKYDLVTCHGLKQGKHSIEHDYMQRRSSAC